MKILKVKILLTILIVSSSFLGCKKESLEKEIETNQLESIQIINGLVVFKNEEVLKSLSESIAKGNKDVISKFQKLKEENNFKSQSDFFLDFSKDLEKSMNVIQYDYVLSSYSDLIAVSPDSVFYLKNGFYSLSEFTNRNGNFKVGDNLRSIKSLSLKKETKIKAASSGDTPRGLIKQSTFTNGSNRKNVVSLYHDYYDKTVVPNTLNTETSIYFISQQYQKNFFGKYVLSTAATYEIFNLSFYVSNIDQSYGGQSAYQENNINYYSGAAPNLTFYLISNSYNFFAQNLVLDFYISTSGISTQDRFVY